MLPGPYNAIMANLITLSRLLLLIAVIVVAYQPPSGWQYLNVVLLVLVYLSDAVDGHVARRRNETTLFGAMFDIAGDRIVELSLWIVFADLDMVPIWVPLVFVARGVIVDTIRTSQARSHRQSPFSMMATGLGKWLVAGKFMRVFYAALKGTTFGWLLLIQPTPAVYPAFWADWGQPLTLIAELLIYLSVLICIVRGLPVIVEFVYTERHALLGRLAGGTASRS